jgi:hypothetical protein
MGWELSLSPVLKSEDPTPVCEEPGEVGRGLGE